MYLSSDSLSGHGTGMGKGGNLMEARFLDTYYQELKRARREHPEEYRWPESEIFEVSARMEAAILRGTFNKDSRAFRATCKRLGIKHTYKAINAFLGAL